MKVTSNQKAGNLQGIGKTSKGGNVKKGRIR